MLHCSAVHRCMSSMGMPVSRARGKMIFHDSLAPMAQQASQKINHPPAQLELAQARACHGLNGGQGLGGNFIPSCCAGHSAPLSHGNGESMVLGEHWFDQAGTERGVGLAANSELLLTQALTRL